MAPAHVPSPDSQTFSLPHSLKKLILASPQVLGTLGFYNLLNRSDFHLREIVATSTAANWLYSSQWQIPSPPGFAASLVELTVWSSPCDMLLFIAALPSLKSVRRVWFRLLSTEETSIAICSVLSPRSTDAATLVSISCRLHELVASDPTGGTSRLRRAHSRHLFVAG